MLLQLQQNYQLKNNFEELINHKTTVYEYWTISSFK